MAHYQVVIEGIQGTADMLNVVNYESSGAALPDFADMADQIRFAIDSHITSFCGANTKWSGITVREDIPGSVGAFVPFGLGELTGTQATPSQVTQLSMLVRKTTNSLVRPTRGWAFQGGLVSDACGASGRWEAGVLAAVKLLWEDMISWTLAGGTTMQMEVKASNPTAPNTQPYTAVTGIIVNDIPSTLDGRKIGTGS